MASSASVTNALVEIAGSTVVVDLEELTFMDSSGIAAIVRAKNRIRADDQGDLLITRPRPLVLRVLEIVGLAGWVVPWSPEWTE